MTEDDAPAKCNDGAKCLQSRNASALSAFVVVGMAKATLHKDSARALAANYAMTIIDGAPRVNELARSANSGQRSCADSRAQPSPLDIWASDDIVALVEEAQGYTGRAYGPPLLVNRKIANTVIGRDVSNSL